MAPPRLPGALLPVGLVVAAVAPAALAAQAPPTASDPGGTRVVLLGTGTPNAEPDRSGPSVAVVVGGVPYLVDAGPGVVRRANAAHRAGVEALDPANLATVFLTHLHSDHTVGLADVLLTPWTLGRAVPLRVYGPEGTREMAEHLRAAYRQDIAMRLYGLEPANDGGHRVEARDVEAGVVFEDERVRVTAVPVHHGSWPTAYAYRFETADRVIVVSGDAAPTEAVVEACDGCDVLVHEVYAKAGWDRRDPFWQRYHADFHTSAVQLGEMAARARPGVLVLYHQLLWGATPDDVLDEIRRAFDGRVVYGRDLDVF